MTARAVELVVQRLPLGHAVGILLVRTAPRRRARYSHGMHWGARLELRYSLSRIRGSRFRGVEPAGLALTSGQREERECSHGRQPHGPLPVVLRLALARGT